MLRNEVEKLKDLGTARREQLKNLQAQAEKDCQAQEELQREAAQLRSQWLATAETLAIALMPEDTQLTQAWLAEQEQMETALQAQLLSLQQSARLLSSIKIR
ncbi:hypothetical protein VRC02_05225 [Erwinia sp. E_sp_B01_3]|uniref:hypothetical protein n=1 Tax=Erwinia sp. E_sp_B01_3 TaxID=3039402 RepID=UPI0030CF0432